MNRSLLRGALVLVLLVFLALAAGGAQSQTTRVRPNIILIVVDDLGWADVACNGSTFYETPNIDRLAAGGVRFLQAYAAAPVCSPTRAALLTGRHPARLHLTDFLKGRRSPPDAPVIPAEYADQLPLEEQTLAEVLRPAGYSTASIGKWHLGGEAYYPEKQGFDVNIAGTQAGSPPSYFWPYEKRAAKLPLAGGKEGEYLTDRLTTEAVRFIESRKEVPFFLYLPYYAVHIPIQARPDLLKKYQAKLKNRPLSPKSQANADYAAMVEAVDQGVGQIMEALRRLQIDRRTLVVFTSDNGGLSTPEGPLTPATSNAPLRAGKGYLYEGGIRVPLIARWPGRIPNGGLCGTPVTSMDLFLTLAEVAGLRPDPSRAARPLDGVSLLPLLRDPSSSFSHPLLYWHYPHFSNQGGRPAGAVRSGDWKLVESLERDAVELFNLREDPGETTNQAALFPERAAELQNKLRRWREEVKANMPLPNRNRKPAPANANPPGANDD